MKKLPVPASILLCALVLAGCSSFDMKKKPAVTLAGFSVDSLSVEDVTFLIEVAIENPYPAGVTFSDLEVNVLVENNSLAKVKTKEGLALAAQGKAVSPFRAVLAFADLERIVKDYASRDYLDCDIVVKLGLPSCLAGSKIDYTLKKKIPVLRPVIAIGDVTITGHEAAAKKGFSLKTLRDAAEGKLGVEFELVVRNRAKARIECTELDYELTVESERVAGGSSEKFRAEGSGSVLTVKCALDLVRAGDRVVGMLAKKKAQYEIKGAVTVKLPDELSKKPVKMLFDRKGAVDFK
jgi:LEA14-like dessication related protein